MGKSWRGPHVQMQGLPRSSLLRNKMGYASKSRAMRDERVLAEADERGAIREQMEEFFDDFEESTG
jgi:hypothetical protein